MFVIIKCATTDDPAKLQVFNPDCYLVQLVQDIRKESTARGRLDEILLLDKDNNLINLTKHMAEDPLQNASHLFKMRAEYLLLTVEKDLHSRPFYKAVADVDEETYERVRSLYHPDALDFSKKRRMAPPKKRTNTKSRNSKGAK